MKSIQNLNLKSSSLVRSSLRRSIGFLNLKEHTFLNPRKISILRENSSYFEAGLLKLQMVNRCFNKPLLTGELWINGHF